MNIFFWKTQMNEEIIEDNQQQIENKFGIKWAWIVVLFATIISTVMFDNETFTYALGHTLGVVVIGFIVSPIVYFILKKFIKTKWNWYYWFNIATTVGFLLNILMWIIIPLARGV